MNFHTLSQTAMLGTERQALDVKSDPSALGQLLGQLDISQREQALLSAAILCGQHERTGALPLLDPTPIPAPCHEESQPIANTHSGTLLKRILEGECSDLLEEWISLATERKRLVPPESLPQLLAIGTSKANTRASILPVIGERGVWVAGQNPDWAWVMGAQAEDESIWHTGAGPARVLFLQKLRLLDPLKARDLLRSTWDTETPEDRAAFIAIMETNLGAEDEPFLESALSDKRKEVRRTAARLLSKLPVSALVQRASGKTKPLLRFVPGESGSIFKLKRARQPVIEVLLPQECDKQMQKDGIELKPPQGIGEKAWWLIQLLEITPLNLWVTEWKVSAREIIAISLQNEWKNELMLGWIRAAVRQQNTDWADCLYSWALDNNQFELFNELLAILPPARREECIASVISSDTHVKKSDFQGLLISQCQHGWSSPFSKKVFDYMRRQCMTHSGDWQTRNLFKDFATRIAPDTLQQALTLNWPVDSSGWDFWSKGVDEFLTIAQFRADIHHAFQS